jgi:hypothetical protein
VGSAVGSGLNLTVGVWQRLELGRAGGRLSAAVGGRLLANTSVAAAGARLAPGVKVVLTPPCVLH